MKKESIFFFFFYFFYKKFLKIFPNPISLEHPQTYSFKQILQAK